MLTLLHLLVLVLSLKLPMLTPAINRPVAQADLLPDKLQNTSVKSEIVPEHRYRIIKAYRCQVFLLSAANTSK